LDGALDGNYNAWVTCSVTDQNGNQVANGSDADDGTNGYAEVVLTFAGTPGSTYTVTGINHAIAVLEVEQFNKTLYEDPYNMGNAFEEGPDSPFPDYFDWYGPGPDEQIKTAGIRFGENSDSEAYIKITFTGQSTLLNGTTQSAVVGQQIALTASFALPNDLVVQSQSWSVPGTTVGGYNASVTSGATVPTNFSQPSTTYYWVDAGNSRTVTFTLNLTDGLAIYQSTATVTFDVSGPTAVTGSASTTQSVLGGSPIALEFGNYPTTHGFDLSVSATAPTGSTGTISFVQLISTYNIEYDHSSGAPCSFSFGTGLDNRYPYKSGPTTTSDSPEIPLNSNDIEAKVNFLATMYLMWTPTLTGAIPVPLGFVTWNWNGDAVQNSGVWSLGSNNSGSAGSFSLSTSYPTWTTSVINGAPPCN